MSRLFRVGLPALLTLAALALVPAAEATDAAQSVVVSSTPVSYTPNIQDGQVNAVAQAGNLMIVGGTFTSVKDLVAAIRAFIDGWNDRCHPFIWTKTADEILPHATRKRTSDARH